MVKTSNQSVENLSTKKPEKITGVKELTEQLNIYKEKLDICNGKVAYWRNRCLAKEAEIINLNKLITKLKQTLKPFAQIQLRLQSGWSKVNTKYMLHPVSLYSPLYDLTKNQIDRACRVLKCLNE